MRVLKPQPQISIKRLNSIKQDDFLRNQSVTLSIKSVNNIQQQKKFIQNLQRLARQQKQKREQTQKKYQQFKQRGAQRQQQFYRIISKLQKKRAQIQTNQQKYIHQLYNKILQTFNAFNQKARELLQDRYSQLYRLLQRRIDILMQKMQKQLSKYRKLSQAQLRQMRDQIKQMSVISAEVQNQNKDLRFKCQNVEFKYKMLNQQKKLMLEEIANLKLYLKKNYNHIKNEKKNMEMTQTKYKDINNSYKNITIDKNYIKNLDSIDLQSTDMKQFYNKKLLSSRSYRYNNKTNKKSNQAIDKQFMNISLNHKNINKNNNNNNNINNNNLKFKTLQPNQSFTINEIKQKNMNENSLNHLKLCLQRQKNKNIQLVRFSLQLQQKQQKIRQIIQKQFQRQKTRSSQTSILLDDKVINTIRNNNLTNNNNKNNITSNKNKNNITSNNSTNNNKNIKLNSTTKRSTSPQLISIQQIQSMLQIDSKLSPSFDQQQQHQQPKTHIFKIKNAQSIPIKLDDKMLCLLHQIKKILTIPQKTYNDMINRSMTNTGREIPIVEHKEKMLIRLEEEQKNSIRNQQNSNNFKKDQFLVKQISKNCETKAIKQIQQIKKYNKNKKCLNIDDIMMIDFTN